MLQSIARSPNYKWWVFGTIAIGIFFNVVDHGSVLVALPEIARHFNTDLPTVQWVVVGYALAISALVIPMGRLGDLMGRKQVYLVGFVIYVAASAAAALSPSMSLLIVSRVLQGIGSAMIQGIAMAMIISAFPSTERGTALGANMSVVGSGSIAGPALGGLLVSALGWRWVFFVNVPVGILTIFASLLILGRAQSERASGDAADRRFDWLGAALSGGVLLLFLMVVGNGDRLGWASYLIVGGAASMVVLLAAFIWWELRITSPMLELRMFQRKLVALGIAAGWISFFGAAATRFMMPFYMQRLLGLSPRDVGLLLIPPAICMIITGPLSGRLSDKFGWRKLTVGGMALSSIASFILAISLAEDSSVVFIVAMLMLQATGMGLFNSPNNSSIFSAVERHRYGVVAALTQLVRNSANVVSVAVATTVVVTVMGMQGVQPSLEVVSPQVSDAFVSGLRVAFLLMGCLTAIGVVVAFVRGERVQPVEAPAAQPRVGEAADD